MTGSAGASAQEKRQSPEYLTLGKIVAPFGIRGEVKALLDTDFPELVLEAAHLYVGDPPLLREVEWARPHKNAVRIKLTGCDDRNAAEALRGQLLQVHTVDAPVPEEGDYYYYQLIGLEVWTDEGKSLGEVVDVWPTGSNEVLQVKGKQGEILLPAIDSVVQEVDLANGRILVHLLEGLW